MIMKRALITGISGQDGAYLAKFLLDKGYQVFGTYRRVSTPNFWRLQHLDIFKNINLIPADLVDAGSMVEAIKLSEPVEIYHLAAQSFVGTSFEQPVGTGEVTGLGVARILEAIRQINPEIRFYQASTSELYGNGHLSSLNEESQFKPSSPYAAAKLYGYWLTRQYRESYNFFACNGILFNHESPL
jgi:GDPmannose 4,6-dehydratase